jgi:hypothetical protein
MEQGEGVMMSYTSQSAAKRNQTELGAVVTGGNIESGGGSPSSDNG